MSGSISFEGPVTIWKVKDGPEMVLFSPGPGVESPIDWHPGPEWREVGYIDETGHLSK